MEILKTTFNKILNATSARELEEICINLRVPKDCHLDLKKYPKLDLSMSKAEIDELKRTGILSDSYDLNLRLAATPLERLLYIFLWKQGDLLKVKHIVQGIMSEGTVDDLDNKDDGLIFTILGNLLEQAVKTQ